MKWPWFGDVEGKGINSYSLSGPVVSQFMHSKIIYVMDTNNSHFSQSQYAQF